MDPDLAKALAGLGGIAAGVEVLASWIVTLVGTVLIYLDLSEDAERLGAPRRETSREVAGLLGVCIRSLRRCPQRRGLLPV